MSMSTFKKQSKIKSLTQPNPLVSQPISTETMQQFF